MWLAVWGRGSSCHRITPRALEDPDRGAQEQRGWQGRRGTAAPPPEAAREWVCAPSPLGMVHFPYFLGAGFKIQLCQSVPWANSPQTGPNEFCLQGDTGTRPAGWASSLRENPNRLIYP